MTNIFNITQNEIVIFETGVNTSAIINGIVCAIFGVFLFYIFNSFVWAIMIPSGMFKYFLLIDQNKKLILTDKRIYYKEGVILQKFQEFLLNKVEGMDYTTAGEITIRATGGNKLVLKNIKHHIEFRNKVIHELEKQNLISRIN